VVMSALTGLAVVAGAALAGKTLAAALTGVAVALLLAAFLRWEERLTARGPAWLARWMARRGSGRGLGARLLARGQETVEMLARLLADRPLRFQAALLGVGIFLLAALAQGAVFHALGSRPHPLVVVVTVALGTAAGTLAGTPGGLGAAEAAMIAVLVALRVNPLDAAAAALLYRALYYAVVLLSGLPAAAYLEWGLNRGRQPAGGEQEEEMT
ncbi:MAG TPA: flippase-like domain-containing protein, partial [Thermoanaerobaculia bacterium]|nr:flippase-like domain-containing protein [Thermoanaerobaculia bacterium]